jgi:hypothetical protein
MCGAVPPFTVCALMAWAGTLITYENTQKINNIIMYNFKIKSAKLQLLRVSTLFGSSSGSTYQLHMYET